MKDPPTQHVAYIGLGANLGDASATIRAAITTLEHLPECEHILSSRLYLSAPIEANGDDYINAVVQLDTHLTPEQLLASLQEIEQHFGRQRSYQNAPRTLDLDLLLFDNQLIHTPTLQVPHPRLAQRAFVLLPLLELHPDIFIPGIGRADGLLAAVSDQRICVLT